MPEALSRGEGVLPELPGAVHMEPGELRKRRMSPRDAAPSRLLDSVLDLYVPGAVPALDDAKIFAGHLSRFRYTK